MTLGGCPIQWSSKLQTEIALSTMEAAYIALSQAMRELLPLCWLLLEIANAMKLPGINNYVIKSTVFEDNNGAIATTKSVKMTPRTKHIGVKYHFFKSHINDESGITLGKIDTNLQKANIDRVPATPGQKATDMSVDPSNVHSKRTMNETVTF
jgi:hypothetical protein